MKTKTKTKRMAKKLSFWARFDLERRRIIAHGLAQFWPYNEELPDNEARESEIYYRVMIARMKPHDRMLLVREMWRLTQKNVKFFSDDVSVDERKKMIVGVLLRFSDLATAAEFEGINFLPWR